MAKRSYFRTKPKKTFTPKKCLYCSKKIKVPNPCSQSTWATYKFCSRSCHYSYRVGKPFPHRGSPWTDKHRENMKGKLTGKNNPFYGAKHSFQTRKKISASHQGIQLQSWEKFNRPSNYLERRAFRHQMQQKVLKRDGFRCVICLSSKDLQVDHIQPWAEYVDQRFNINNCRTLCAKCHYQITFGKPMPPTVRAWGHNFYKGGIKNI